jgi:hypothetical protein
MGAADGLWERIGASMPLELRPRYERLRQDLIKSLGQESFDHAREQGKREKIGEILTARAEPQDAFSQWERVS